jgi:hypothetical protein
MTDGEPSSLPTNPRQSVTWTPAEDAALVWLILCCPFTEFSRCWSRELPGKKPETAVPRFLEILASPDLVHRVNNDCRQDVICHKTAPWTRHEHLSLLRLVASNAHCNPVHFLKDFPMLFHPSRTSALLTSTNSRLSSKDNCFESGVAQFREFVSKIREEAVGKEPATIELTVDDVEAVLAAEANPPDEPVPAAALTVEGLRARANEQITPKDFGALVGAGPVRVLKKAKTVFGRGSPKCKPDVDLADLNLQSISRLHCTISLATDLHFYARCDGTVILVNGLVFGKGATVRLNDRDIIDIGGACFVFFENQALLEQLRSLK